MCVYVNYYGGFSSVQIRIDIICIIIALILNIWRASFIRHPFISNQTWTYKMVYITISLFILIDILLAPSHILEHIYIESILNYDTQNLISLNWISVCGIITGAYFTYKTFALRKWRYKTMTVIAFSAILVYLAIFYFKLDYGISKQ